MKGRSGNPAGKPKGTRHKTTMAVEALFDGEAEGLTRKAIEKALAGDSVALRLCLDRICPPRKDRPVSLDLPKIESAGDAEKAIAAIIDAVASGEITPSEASEVTGLIAAFTKAREVSDLEARIEALERKEATGDKREVG